MKEKKMRKFCVSVERVYVHSSCIDIIAKSINEAENKALKMISNICLKIDRVADIEDRAEVMYEYKEK
jgi:hypothetical protein